MFNICGYNGLTISEEDGFLPLLATEDNDSYIDLKFNSFGIAQQQ